MHQQSRRKVTRFVYANFPHRIYIYSPSFLGSDYRLFFQCYNSDNWNANLAASADEHVFSSYNPACLLNIPLFRRNDSERKASFGDIYPFLFNSVNQMPSDGNWTTIKYHNKLLRFMLSHATLGNQNHLWHAEIQTENLVIFRANITTPELMQAIKDLFLDKWNENLCKRIKQAIREEIDSELMLELPVITPQAASSLKRLLNSI